MFYWRELELQTMNRRYEKGRFECIVIYGRKEIKGCKVLTGIRE